MKRGLLILLIALAAGAAAYVVTRSHQQQAAGTALLDTMPELAWLKGELGLSDEQFAKASELHAAYRPQCEEMCHRIAMARCKLESLAETGRGMTPELAEAIREHARVHAECQERMLGHLYQTAALMDGNQARRYLETMVPHALGSPAPEASGGHPH